MNKTNQIFRTYAWFFFLKMFFLFHPERGQREFMSAPLFTSFLSFCQHFSEKYYLFSPSCFLKKNTYRYSQSNTWLIYSEISPFDSMRFTFRNISHDCLIKKNFPVSQSFLQDILFQRRGGQTGASVFISLFIFYIYISLLSIKTQNIT